MKRKTPLSAKKYLTLVRRYANAVKAREKPRFAVSKTKQLNLYETKKPMS